MEMLLLRAPTSVEKLRLARILVEAYGDESGVDGPSLYRQFLRACGVPEGEEVTAGLCQEVWAFVRVPAAARNTGAPHSAGRQRVQEVR